MNFQKKIKTLNELKQISKEKKKDGKKITLCHGTFDLLHIGHVRHFQQAKKTGDILIVTITADQFVVKGPDRPYFTENLRAEMIASLTYIDYVAIIEDFTAIPSIESIKPNFYVKGSDYKNQDEDMTGKIKNEVECVKKNSGKLIITEDIIFSSSNLINKHFRSADEELEKLLDNVKKKGGFTYFEEKIEDIYSKKILFIGETIIDEYVYVDSLGKASKESIIAQHFNTNEIFAGGVIAAAKHTANFCKNVRILTTFGSNDNYLDFVKKSVPKNIKLIYEKLKNKPTTRKQRFVDRSYLRKMSEIYYMDDSPLKNDEENQFISHLEKNLKWADVVIVTDFGHGLMNTQIIEKIEENAKFLSVNVQTNSSNRGYNLFTKYQKANFLCIDEPELRLATQQKFAPVNEILKHIEELIDCKHFIVTHGKYGCIVKDNNNFINKVPALVTNIIDSVGAGDAFLAITSPFVASGLPMSEVGILGNIAGAIKVNIIGHRFSVDKITFMKYLKTLLK
tara:strand:+ start:20275 stop:21801 length:1527 start_codon:yes stop_codon:yes gene_type:complete